MSRILDSGSSATGSIDLADRAGKVVPDILCAVLGFRNFLRATLTSKEKGMIFGNDVSYAGDVVGKPVMQEAYEMGRSV